MVNCAICGTPGVNKSTCPLVLKNPSEENWKKHYKAERKKPKLKIVQPNPSPSKPKPKPNPNPTPSKVFRNIYIKKSDEAQKVKNKII